MTFADRIVIGLAVVAIGALYALLWGAENGEMVEIYTAGGTLEVPLAQDSRFTVDGPLGATRLEVHQGRIRFVDSPCDNRQCIHAGWLERPGESAACLPNRVSILVKGKNPLYDAVSF